MSSAGCRINTNLTNGSGVEKSTNEVLSKEINDKFAALMAAREKQDKDLASEALTDKEYEAKYGKQPGGTDGKKAGVQ
jgi:hypothetical protein